MTLGLRYIITIPSIDIEGHASAGDLMLLGSKDSRYQSLLRGKGVLPKYLKAFRTHFGRKVLPSIIVTTRKEGKIPAEEIAAFRNAIAVSAVVYSRCKSCLYASPTGYYCTDLFDFHPVSVSSDGDDLSIRTAHEIGAWEDVAKFRGGTTLAVVHPETIRPTSDDEFTLLLLNLIEKQSRKQHDLMFRNRVFRSLEMAYYALRAPFMNLGSQTDFGVAVSLWVSAFETLANPHTRNVSFSHVSTMIKAVCWKDRRLRVKRHAKIGEDFGRKLTKEKTTLPVQVYGRLYYTRHMYLHGNPVPKGQYEFARRKGWGSLHFQVPALYRCALRRLLVSEGIRVEKAVADECRSYERVLLKRAD